VHSRTDHEELIAPQSSDVIATSYGAAKAIGHVDEKTVAGGVTIPVVH
jgi:hypothetical protein